MTGVKVSALPAAGALAGGEVVPVVQNGVTVRTTVSLIADTSTGEFLQVANNLSDVINVPAARSNLGLSTVATENTVPVAKGGISLGVATVSWSDLFLASGGVINWANGNYTITHSTATLTFSGTVATPASTTTVPSFRIPHGTAPTSPIDGDMWTTTAGLFVRINGSTVGPLT